MLFFKTHFYLKIYGFVLDYVKMSIRKRKRLLAILYLIYFRFPPMKWVVKNTTWSHLGQSDVGIDA